MASHGGVAAFIELLRWLRDNISGIAEGRNGSQTIVAGYIERRLILRHASLNLGSVSNAPQRLLPRMVNCYRDRRQNGFTNSLRSGFKIDTEASRSCQLLGHIWQSHRFHVYPEVRPIPLFCDQKADSTTPQLPCRSRGSWQARPPSSRGVQLASDGPSASAICAKDAASLSTTSAWKRTRRTWTR